MREAFIQELVAQARANPKIFLVIGDIGYSIVEPFAEEFPERFINAGVAEQNMTGLAAGLSSEGYHVFTYSIANFPTFRCAEQIRNDIDYHLLPVTIVSVGGGLGYGPLGYSHHALQDYGLMRSMPNMLIAAPGDTMETRACVQYLVANPGPSYLRLGKTDGKSIHEKIPKIEPGTWLQVVYGDSSSTFLSTGSALEIAIERRKKIGFYYPSVHSLPLWGMNSKASQKSQLETYENVTTFEDHLIDGGFGSWMLESLIGSEYLYTRLKIQALNSNVCGAVGTQRTLLAYGGLIA